MSHYISLYIKKDIKLHKIIYVLVHRNFLIYLVRQPYQRDMACWASWLSLWLIPWKIWLLWVHCIDAPRVSWEQEGCCGAWKTKWRGWSAPVCVLPVPPGHSPSSTFFMADLPFSMFLTAANSYICISSAPGGELCFLWSSPLQLTSLHLVSRPPSPVFLWPCSHSPCWPVAKVASLHQELTSYELV